MENNIEHPDYQIVTKILACSNKVGKYVLEQINATHFEPGEPLSFQIPIPLNIDPLLASVFDVTWTEESKVALFDVIRASFRQLMDNDFTDRIEQKINSDIFPSKNKEVKESVESFVIEEGDMTSVGAGTTEKYFVVDNVEIYDEPSINLTVTTKIGDEIVAEESEDLSVETITVEINISEIR